MEEIALERQLTAGSIAGHLVQLARAGYDIDLEGLLASEVSSSERAAIEKAVAVVGLSDGRLKTLYEHLNGRYSYVQLTLVTALLER
jgi:ATP-dependent DNA helicase RecQ